MMKTNFTSFLSFTSNNFFRVFNSGNNKKSIGLVCAYLLFQSFSFGQTILYDESMDAGTGAVNGGSIAAHESNGRFSETSLTFSGTADMRNTLPSSGYTTATGNFNVMFNSTGESLLLDGLNFTSCLSEIVLSFGIRKGTNLSDGSSMLVQYNTTDEPNIFNKITIPTLPTGAGTATWYYISSTSLIPSNVKSIRFSSTSAVELRIDDIHIECNTVVCPAPTVLGNPVNITSCQNQPVTFGSFGESTTTMTYQWQVDTGSGFVDLVDNAVYDFVDEDSLKILNVTGAMTGYKYRCKLVNTCGTSFTTEGILTVDAVLLPTITASGPLTFCLGSSVTLTSSSATNNQWSTGATTQSIVVTGADDYTVKVTNNNCSETSVKTVVKVNDPSFSMDNIINPTTCISLDGSVRLNGSASGVVSWTGPVTGNSGASVPLPYTVGALQRGTYDFTFTVSAGCTSTASITLIGDIPVPLITASGPLTFCDGDSVILTSDALIGNTWSSGETTKSIVVKTSGTYDVTVTSGTCVKTSSDTVVTVNPVTVLSVSGTTAPSSCGLLDGDITVSGVGTGTLSWSGAATGTMAGVTLPQTISGLGAGTYTISFSTAFCASEDIDQTLTDPGAPATPIITAGGPLEFCDGGSVTLTSSSATDNTWSTGETTASIVVTTTSDISVSVTNLSGCTSASAVTEVISHAYPAVPTISVDDTVAFCMGGSVTLTSSSLANNTWSDGATTQSITVNSAGTYNVTVSNNGCTTTSTDTIVSIYTNTNLLVGTTVNPTSCGSTNGYIEISGINGPGNTGTISWTGPSSNAGAAATLPYSASNLASGTYDFSFTTTDGCIGQSSVTINGPSVLPTISASGVTTFCEGGNVVLGSSSAIGNSWSGGETSQNITVTTSGTYTVTVTDGTCTLTSNPTVVTVTPRPVLASGTMTSPSVCGDNDGSIEITGSGTGNLIWVGTASGSANGISLPFTVSNLETGSYDFRFDNGCLSNIYTFVLQEASVPSTPVITAGGSTSFCTGQSVVLTSTAAPNYSWNSGASTQSITATFSGNYTVSVTEGFCTETSDPLTVTVVTAPPTPSISSSDADNTVCDGNTITLTSTAGATSSWSDGSIGSSIDVSSSGTFTVSFTQGGCTVTSSSVSVTVNPIPATPVITAGGPTTFCENGSVILTSSASSGNSWSTGSSQTSITVTTSGTFTVTVIQNGCSATSTAVTITENPLPSVFLTPYNQICDTLPPFTLNQGLPAGGVYTVNGVTATTFDPGVANIGNNTIVYTVTENGCSASASQNLPVVLCTIGLDENAINLFEIYPNPTNGALSISGENLSEIKSIEVRDELGRLVKTYDQQNIGQLNISELSNGVYTLIIKGNAFDEIERIQLFK